MFAIDVAKEDFVGALMKPDRRVLITIKWKHPEETRTMMKRLVETIAVEHLEVVLEPSGSYGDPVRQLSKKTRSRKYWTVPKAR